MSGEEGVGKRSDRNDLLVAVSSERNHKLSAQIKSESAVLCKLRLHADLKWSQSTVGGRFPQLTSQPDREGSNPYLPVPEASRHWHADLGNK